MAERKSFPIRIDPKLWSDLESWAEAELRSINGQIESLLREAINRRKCQIIRQEAKPDAPPMR